MSGFLRFLDEKTNDDANDGGGDADHVGSVLVYWYADGTGLRTPPPANVPQGAGTDPHEAPRRYGPAVDQVATWLREGRLVDVCHGQPCTIPAHP